MNNDNEFLKAVKLRTSLKITAIEEITWGMGSFSNDGFEKLIEVQGKISCGKYLERIIK